MSIELVSVGDELLNGLTINTNAAYMSLKLSEGGWKVARQTTLSDEIGPLTSGLRETLERSSLVIATGGLGPTLDDVSAEAAQTLFTSPPEILPNPVGSASGLLFEDRNKKLIMLPGVPQEMQVMFEESVLPLVRQTVPKSSLDFRAVLYFCRLKETELDPTLRELRQKGVRSGIYPSYGTVAVRLYAPTQELLDEACSIFPKKWPRNFFTAASGKIEEAIQKKLISNGETLALAESCTGGLIAAQLTARPGASDYFLGSCVVYSNRLKEQILGVRPQTLQRHGAVSEEAVREMLEGVFNVCQSDWGISVSGIAGPSGGTLQKPVGTVWYALGKRNQEPVVGKFDFQRKNRETIILMSTNWLLGELLIKISCCRDSY